MRDIKFRGKTTQKSNSKHAFNEIWCYGDLITTKHKYFIHPKNNVFKNENELSRLMITHEIDKNTLGQYTGLKDENGKEIYEGDIVESYGRKFVVEYRKDRGGFSPFACGDGCGCCEDEVVSQYALENNSAVIGNIYDNPDLLEKGAEE